MAKTYIFKNISNEILRWHPELGEGENQENYFEYMWFDAPLQGADGVYYLRISPFSSVVKGSHGAETGGLPGLGFDLLLPNGECLDSFIIYDPREYEALPFGGIWGTNAFTGTVTDDGFLDSFEIKMNIEGVGIDLKARTVANGLQFVEADHGYTYYHPVKKRALGWWPLAPRADVEGILTIGGKEIRVKGPSYLDRQLGNLPTAFGGSGQAWWTWGHFWAGDYTGTFTDSAPTAKYKYRHFSPFMLWKGSELVLATFDFTGYVEQFSVDETSGKFYPKVQSQKARDGSVEFTSQITNGILVEPTTTSLEETTRYVRQFADITMQLNRFGGIEEEISGKIVAEFGAGLHFMPWSKLK